MNIAADERLAPYVCDYADGTMDPTLKSVFEEYIHENSPVYYFVQQVISGKSTLQQIPRRELSDDFNEELWNKLELEKKLDQLELDYYWYGEDDQDGEFIQTDITGEANSGDESIWV